MFCSDFVPGEPLNIAQFTSDLDEELDAMDQYEYMQQYKQQQQLLQEQQQEEEDTLEVEQDHEEERKIHLKNPRNLDSPLYYQPKQESKLPF